MNRILLLTALLTIMHLNVMAQSGQTPTTQLLVWTKDGTSAAYALNEKPVITFISDSTVITTNTLEVKYRSTDMLRFTFSNAPVTGITTPDGKGDTPFSLSGNTLIFPENDTDVTVAVYTLDGKAVMKRNIRRNNSFSISLDTLPDGIYLVRVNGITYKITKK